jgi:DNA-binding PadR family transcriptional regulator
MPKGIDAVIRNYSPMSEPSLLVLASLQQERHGYGIMQAVAAVTDGRVHLGAGTVYTILYKMEQDGVIEAVREVERRKTYRMTDLGRELLNYEHRRINQLQSILQNKKEAIAATQ